MNIITVVTGMLEENTYIVYEEGQRGAALIDPGADADKIIGELEKHGLRAEYILLTHGHADHIGAVREVKEKYGAKVAIHERDSEMPVRSSLNLSYMLGDPIELDPPDIILHDGDEITAAGLTFTVLHTPGHSGGSVCYQAGDALFTGDLLFQRSIGRTDFPGSDKREMGRSLMRIRALREDYKIYPGHGPASSLHMEFDTNPFL